MNDFNLINYRHHTVIEEIHKLKYNKVIICMHVQTIYTHARTYMRP